MINEGEKQGNDVATKTMQYREKAKYKKRGERGETGGENREKL